MLIEVVFLLQKDYLRVLLRQIYKCFFYLQTFLKILKFDSLRKNEDVCINKLL